jgi:hypothetical protein
VARGIQDAAVVARPEPLWKPALACWSLAPFAPWERDSHGTSAYRRMCRQTALVQAAYRPAPWIGHSSRPLDATWDPAHFALYPSNPLRAYGVPTILDEKHPGQVPQRAWIIASKVSMASEDLSRLYAKERGGGSKQVPGPGDLSVILRQRPCS